MLIFQAKAPSRKKLRTLINKLALEVSQKMKTALSQTRKVSVTTDIWSSKGCQNSYLGITAHSFNPVTRKKENYRISCRLFDCSHTGRNIAKMMKRIFVEFGIQSKISIILSDNASNAIKSVRDLNGLQPGEEEFFEESDSDADSEGSDSESECDEAPDEDSDEDLDIEELANNIESEEVVFANAFEEEEIVRGRCIVHTMQLPICRICKKKRSSFGRVLRKTKKYVVKYRISSKAKAILRKTSFKLRLKGWVKTRWWSDIEMVARIVKAAESPGRPLETLSDKMGWTIDINEKDVSELKNYLTIMTPFMDMGNKLGAEKLSTMHLVFPIIRELLQQLDQHIKDKNHPSYCKDLSKEIERYFKFLLDPSSEEFDPLYITATYLCPVYRFALDDEMKEKAIKNLKTIVKKSSQEDIEEVHDDNAEDSDLDVYNNNVEIALPGFKILSAKIFNSDGFDRRPNEDGDIDLDLKQYEAKSKIYMDRVKAKAVDGAKNNEKMELKVIDPLDFWIKEV